MRRSTLVPQPVIKTIKTSRYCNIDGTFTVNYHNTFDLVSFHEEVTDKINSDCDVLALESELITLKTKYLFDTSNEISDQISELSKRIEDIKSKPTRLDNATKQILLKYNELLSKRVKTNTILNLQTCSLYVPSQDDLEMIEVIRTYAYIASSFVQIKYTCSGEIASNIHDLCVGCGIDIKSLATPTYGIIVCPSCCAINNSGIRGIDLNKTSTGIHNSITEDISAFIRAMDTFEGKVKLPPNLDLDVMFNRFDVYFTHNRYPTRHNVADLPYTRKGTRLGTNFRSMLVAFDDLNYNCYDCMYYICNAYWLWKPHDISNIKDELKEDFRKFKGLWALVPVEERGDRKSIVPVMLLLCTFLMKREYPCSYDDFKLPDKYINMISIIKHVYSKDPSRNKTY